ncbi:chloride channel protein [Oculatella sp. LEGE 06141]|uniref:chloride channel protein n=1 Tax=Oculatella sp. LEGE 06141 TaxID=1828648 RepID=UPI00187E4325|nr:chloride channel protein [Oculatella sp. LEGE 06141]MBE9177814.1 chloride channel protein [Oculatella sp. LEGE 06141]
MWSLSIPRQLRHLLLGSKRLAIFEACVIGVVSGLAAVLLKQGVGWLGGWRVYASYAFPAWITLPLIGLVGGFLAGWLVERLAPEAAGSGIPQVKAALANVPIALNLRVAIAKMMSVILIMGSGFNLGRQGPTVQVGAALAAQLSQWIPTSPEYRRQLLAAGAAAGLAAGFNAPIAGVLFVVEEFLQDFSGLTLGTAILASFVGAVVSRLLGDQGLNLAPSMTELQASFSLEDVPFFIVLGLLAGLLGALFSNGIFVSLAFYRRVIKLGLPWKIGLAGLITGAIVVMLPAAFRDSTGLQEFVNRGEAQWQVILLAFVVKFCLTLVAYGSGAPGGIFAPALILGSSLGYLVGFSAHSIEPLLGLPSEAFPGIGSTTTYALAGMGAFFSAVTRGPITAIVIVFEMTTDFNMVLPLMIGSVIAYLVADRFASGSIYSRLLAWNGIDLEKDATGNGNLWTTLTAATLMQRRVETLSSHLPVSEAMQAFSRSHHRGFPVVDGDKLVGIVTQSDLADMTRRSSSTAEVFLRDIMTPQPVTVSPKDPLTQVLYLLNRFKLSRLPVTEGHKLVGIITRADIIRAESDYLSGETRQFGPQPEPSYVVYQTRSPAVGAGRILVPLSNPRTAPLLLKLAAAIARDRDYELECLHVIIVPRSHSPAETTVRTTMSRRLLRQAEHFGQKWQVPVHTQARVAHDAAQAMLECIKERHIDLTLMGWKGSTSTPGRVFGNAVDTLIRQAACEVILVKLEEFKQFNRWLVPIAGGPNAQEALQLLPALTALAEQPDVLICQIFEAHQQKPDTTQLTAVVADLSDRLNCPVAALPVWGNSVPEVVTQLAQQEATDVIMLGASREGLLKQVISGNIPEAIARHSNQTVILVRGATASADHG